MKAKDLAPLIEGIVEGDGNVEITGLNGIETAKTGDLTFAMDEDKLALAEKCAASCILTCQTPKRSAKTLIKVKNPKLAFLMIYNFVNKPEARSAYIHPTAAVDKSVKLGKDVWIGQNASIDAGVVIGDNTIIEANSSVGKRVAIGSRCRLYPNVTLYENVVLKNNVILHAGVVVGSDGFGYVKEKGKIYKFPQTGRVIIEDDVEIGANTTIDRGSLSDTVIGQGTKIDNLCQIAHNVKIGKNVLIAAECGISGSSTVGDNVTMGGQAGVVDNVTIGDDVMVGAQAGVIGDVEKGKIVWGIPARDISFVKKQMAVLGWLTKNFKSIQKLLSKSH